jgi:hypothetical protein
VVCARCARRLLVANHRPASDLPGLQRGDSAVPATLNAYAMCQMHEKGYVLLPATSEEASIGSHPLAHAAVLLSQESA